MGPASIPMCQNVARFNAQHRPIPARASLLMILGHVLGAVQLLEQPAHHATGGMESHGRMRDMFRTLTAKFSVSIAATAAQPSNPCPCVFAPRSTA